MRILSFVSVLAKNPPFWTSRQPLNPIQRVEEVNKWLHTCLKGHQRCNVIESSLKSKRPTRLIDVSQQVPRLACSFPRSSVSYVALSHCWGGVLPIKTTKETLSEHFTAIQLADMPKTYRDAVTVTRELGIRYLWIDSLCIVQDDPKDWEKEAASMASIYEGARLTIAAAWGKDAESGIFHDHRPSIFIEANEQNEIDQASERSVTRFLLRELPNEYEDLTYSPLYLRAWALQEFVLSRRTVIFATGQLYWYCRCSRESEGGVHFSSFALPSSRFALLSRLENSTLYHDWIEITEHYSHQSLSFARDKLAALAGVTRFFETALHSQAKVEDEPLAGLWKNDLYRGLLWRRDNKTARLDEEAVQSLNIPSWSWLKVRGSVWTPRALGGPCIDISRTRVTWTGLPLVSKIGEAYIMGRGKLLNVQKIEKDEQSTCFCASVKLCIEGIHHGPTSYNPFEDLFVIDECTSDLNDTHYCLPVMSSPREDPTSEQQHTVDIQGLLITPTQSQSHQLCHQRVGYLEINDFPKDIWDEAPITEFTLI